MKVATLETDVQYICNMTEELEWLQLLPVKDSTSSHRVIAYETVQLLQVKDSTQ